MHFACVSEEVCVRGEVRCQRLVLPDRPSPRAQLRGQLTLAPFCALACNQPLDQVLTKSFPVAADQAALAMAIERVPEALRGREPRHPDIDAWLADFILRIRACKAAQLIDRPLELHDMHVVRFVGGQRS